MNYSTKQIEDAIITTLGPLVTAPGAVVKTLGSYEGQFEEAVDADNQLLVVTPAVLVTYVGSMFDPDSGPYFDRSLTFAVMHGSSNLQSETKRRADVYSMLEATRALLNNNDLGLAIMPLYIEQEKIVASSRHLTVYSAQYQTSYLEDSNLY